MYPRRLSLLQKLEWKLALFVCRSRSCSGVQFNWRRTKLSRLKDFKEMNLIQRKIYLYNVTFGLYMLDWWERCLFNILVIVLLWFVCYNGSRSAIEFYTRHLKGRLEIAGSL